MSHQAVPITVKLFATFQRGRFAVESRPYTPEMTVGQVVDDLAIPRREVGVMLVNGRHVEFARCLDPGDTLSIFPVIGGG